MQACQSSFVLRRRTIIEQRVIIATVKRLFLVVVRTATEL